jgi:hypothetical protein
MTDLTPEKIKELTALMASAPPATAARLLAMFERMKVEGNEVIPSNALIVAMREAGKTQVTGPGGKPVRLPTLQRLFFEPFQNLFESCEPEKMLPGSLPRSGLNEVWSLVAGHFIPAEVVEIELHSKPAILSGDMEKARSFAWQLRKALLKTIVSVSKQDIVSAGKTPAACAILARLVPLLIAEERGRDTLATAIDCKGELSELIVRVLCAQVRQLEEQHPDAARELLLLTMSNLPKPSEALRVLKGVSPLSNDRRLDATEFSVIGRRVIASAARAADVIQEAARTGKFDGAVLAATTESYHQSLQGLEREANLASDGPWRKAMLVIRDQVGNSLDTICQNVTLSLEVALPVERIQSLSLVWTQEPRIHTPLDQERVEIAIQGLRFIANAGLIAPLAGFGASRQQAAKHAGAYLDNVCKALLRLARFPNKPESLPPEWVNACTSLLEALDGVKAAHVFERRINASASAA